MTTKTKNLARSERTENASAPQHAATDLARAVGRAVQLPTLADALTYIAVWETERAVRQARENAEWDTCFKVCFQAVMKMWQEVQDWRDCHDMASVPTSDKGTSDPAIVKPSDVSLPIGSATLPLSSLKDLATAAVGRLGDDHPAIRSAIKAIAKAER